MSSDLLEIDFPPIPSIDSDKSEHFWQMKPDESSKNSTFFTSSKVLEFSVFPVVAGIALSASKYGSSLPILSSMSYDERMFHLINLATNIAAIQPWIIRDLHRWQEAQPGDRTQWLPAYALFWAIQVGMWEALHATGNSLVWSGMAGYTLMEFLCNSREISEEDETHNYIMSLVSAVAANVYYATRPPSFLAEPSLSAHTPPSYLSALTLVPHLLGTLGGMGIFKVVQWLKLKQTPARAGVWKHPEI